tara:strand:- start:382 stop:774 length:393 start_codon:yes stop_codon:yes gene_type:complete
MKKNEFKKILKPLIKEAVKEVLFEPGVLSRVIAEVTRGTQGAPLVEVNQEDIPDQKELARLHEEKRQQRIKRLNESAGLNAGVFDRVSDVPDAPSQGPLAGVRSADAGVDISAITKIAGGSRKWKTLIGK